jgi:hypothetical protein
MTTSMALAMMQMALQDKASTVSIAFTEEESCLLLSALAVFEDRQVQWARIAEAKGRAKEAAARKETGRRILTLSDRIEKEAV